MGDSVRADVEAAMQQLSEGSNADAAPADVAPAGDGGGGDAGAAPGAEAAGGTEAAGAGAEAPESAASAAARARDGKGRFAPGGIPPVPPALAPRGGVEGKPPGGAKQGQGGAAPAPPSPGATSPAEAFKPPTSWKPAAREEWAKLPPAVQAEVARVDREVVSTLREAAGAKRFAETFSQALAPYTGVLQAEGGNPVQTITGLLQTAQALRGPDKEAVMARIIKQFGGNIEKLAAHLDGVAAPQGQQGQQPPEYRDPRVDQLFGTLQQVAAQRQQATATKAQSDLDAFREKAEFLDDVSGHMSVLLHDAAARGQGMTLQEAYERACWADPEVRVYFQRRQAAEAAKATTASTQQARQAALSVRSQPTGSSPAPNSSGSTRDDVLAAMEQLEGRG